ncbi:hypothetical protein ACJW30_03G126500 [Castanea mollissima]
MKSHWLHCYNTNKGIRGLWHIGAPLSALLASYRQNGMAIDSKTIVTNICKRNQSLHWSIKGDGLTFIKHREKQRTRVRRLVSLHHSSSNMVPKSRVPLGFLPPNQYLRGFPHKLASLACLVS